MQHILKMYTFDTRITNAQLESPQCSFTRMYYNHLYMNLFTSSPLIILPTYIPTSRTYYLHDKLTWVELT
jgi:hypothetical protein